MPTELDLLEAENVGSIFTIIGYSIFVISALMAIKMEQARLNGTELSFTPSPSQVTAQGTWVYIIGSAVLFIVSAERIKQRKIQLQSGAATGTLRPNLWIGAGALLTLMSALALDKGNKIRIQEEGQITII